MTEDERKAFLIAAGYPAELFDPLSHPEAVADAIASGAGNLAGFFREDVDG